jgi:hypothetical protein
MRIGSCQLRGIPPAPKGEPRIAVTFEVDRSCDVKVEALEAKSGGKIETTLEKAGASLTNDLIRQLIREAEENREEDKARSVMASAELRVRKDQEQDSVTETTIKIEKLIADLGVALMDGDFASLGLKTTQLETLLAGPEQIYSPYVALGDIFSDFFPQSAKKETQLGRRTTQAPSKPIRTEGANSLSTVTTHALIQSFLESIDPELEVKRVGAWEAVESNRAEGPVQASHSMRELLRQMLDRLAPREEVLKAPWYQKPKSGAPVTRAQRVQYAIAGISEISSESAIGLINDLAAAVDSMYGKLSAESHSSKRIKASDVKMYLAACEAVIGLIASQRRANLEAS